MVQHPFVQSNLIKNLPTVDLFLPGHSINMRQEPNQHPGKAKMWKDVKQQT